MQYLAVFQTKSELAEDPPDDMPELLPNEQAQGRKQYAAGELRQSWEIDDERHGAVCLFEADSRDDLQSMVDSYPLVQKGYVDVLVVALKPDGAYLRQDD